LANQLENMTIEQLEKESSVIKTKAKKHSSGNGFIFIGHGRSKIWARVQVFLKDELKLQTVYFERESRTSEAITDILSEFLDKSSFAIIVFTAEDDTSEGKTRARQNVVHEVGLFQGRLGFDKVIILKQEGVEEFTNIAGLQYIPFTNDAIEQTFYELQRKLKKIGLIK
jgi:predicted nucleotide-binding protein